jgi:hypothetical protein
MWEYAVHYVKHKAPFGNVMSVKIDDGLKQFMAQMGREGWELTAATPNIFAGTHQGDISYFKRPKQS